MLYMPGMNVDSVQGIREMGLGMQQWMIESLHSRGNATLQYQSQAPNR